MSNQLNFIDLFCGIGGFHQALLKINKEEKEKVKMIKKKGLKYTPKKFVCVLASDNNKACQMSYRENYMNDKFIKSHNNNFKYKFNEDICELSNTISESGDQFDINNGPVPKFDIICGGFPCQPFSNSGKKMAFEDTRGTLFHDIMTLAKSYQPRFMFLENVKHIKKVSNGQVYQTILNCLKDEGYMVYVNEISPHQLGIPQQRERVIFSCIKKNVWLNASQDHTEEKMIELFGTEMNLGITETSPELSRVINSKGLDEDDSGYIKSDFKISSELEEVLNAWDEMIQVIDVGDKLSPTILAKDLNKEYFDTAIVDGQKVVKRQKIITEFKNKKGEVTQKITFGNPIVKSEFSEEYNKFPDWKKDLVFKNKPIYWKYKNKWDEWLDKHEDLINKKEIYAKLEWQAGPKKENDSIWNYFINMRQSGIRVKKTEYFPTLVAIVQTPIYGKEKRYITPRECARLQSFPDDFKCHPKHHTAYKQFGNAVNVDVVYSIIKTITDLFVN
jgi:DNA (cytosine-5)-methyltransferase 1